MTNNNNNGNNNTMTSNTKFSSKLEVTKHVRINDIDFNYFMGWKMLMVSYPDGTDETFHKLTYKQANDKVGSILENMSSCS